MYLYLIRGQKAARKAGDKLLWYVKIGVTHDMERRLKQLQTGNPHPLETVRVYEHASESRIRRLEKMLHRKYQRYRRQGEWFLVNSNVEWGIEMDIMYADRYTNM